MQEDRIKRETQGGQSCVLERSYKGERTVLDEVCSWIQRLGCTLYPDQENNKDFKGVWDSRNKSKASTAPGSTESRAIATKKEGKWGSPLERGRITHKNNR